ncbi:MAG: glycosyltransferase family 4 protein [Halobacteriovoraceae bacterium]|jgi:glycosyltransferase involved in cell wall biosynthesis|nr:glycosyltransferase family 4 protein [Halobacteriovoraceae bacterium]MBT5093616.1 glycosyltransferase family 4 protein [Halobacteriovoraceae bacterium]
MKSRKVLVIGHPLVVDANRQLWNTLAKHPSYQVDLIVPKSWPSNLLKKNDFQFNKETDQDLNKIYSLRTVFKGSGSFFFFNPIKIAQIFWWNRYDVVLLTQETWSLSLFFIHLLKFLSPNNKALFYLTVCQNIKKKKLYFLRFFERFNTWALDSILCCCSEIEQVIRWKGIKKECRYFPFSYDDQLYRSKAPKFDSKKIVLGYMGRLSEEKGISLLLKVFTKMKGENENLSLLIAGAGPLEASLQEIDGVTFLGALPHQLAHTFYNQIDIFVLPSQTRSFWKEQFGRVIIEAVASGCPVVGSSSGAIPEVLSMLGLETTFQEDSEEELTKKLQQVIDQIEEGVIVDFMEKARQKATELYTHEGVVQRLIEYIEKPGQYGLIESKES